MSKTTLIEHKDRLGRNLSVGDCVAVAHRNELMIGTIKKLNPKMLNVVEVGSRGWRASDGYKKYPSECVQLSGADVTMYLLKLSAKN